MSDSEEYDSNSVNSSSERSKPKKRKRNSTNEDRANSSVLDSSDLHGVYVANIYNSLAIKFYYHFTIIMVNFKQHYIRTS